MPSKGGDGTDRGKISKTCRYRMFLDMAEDILCLDEEEYFDLCSESPRRRGRYVDPDDFAGDISVRGCSTHSVLSRGIWSPKVM